MVGPREQNDKSVVWCLCQARDVRLSRLISSLPMRRGPVISPDPRPDRHSRRALPSGRAAPTVSCYPPPSLAQASPPPVSRKPRRRPCRASLAAAGAAQAGPPLVASLIRRAFPLTVTAPHPAPRSHPRRLWLPSPSPICPSSATRRSHRGRSRSATSQYVALLRSKKKAAEVERTRGGCLFGSFPYSPASPPSWAATDVPDGTAHAASPWSRVLACRLC